MLHEEHRLRVRRADPIEGDESVDQCRLPLLGTGTARVGSLASRASATTVAGSEDRRRSIRSGSVGAPGGSVREQRRWRRARGRRGCGRRGCHAGGTRGHSGEARRWGLRGACPHPDPERQDDSSHGERSPSHRHWMVGAGKRRGSTIGGRPPSGWRYRAGPTPPHRGSHTGPGPHDDSARGRSGRLELPIGPHACPGLDSLDLATCKRPSRSIQRQDGGLAKDGIAT